MIFFVLFVVFLFFTGIIILEEHENLLVQLFRNGGSIYFRLCHKAEKKENAVEKVYILYIRLRKYYYSEVIII